MNRKTRRQLKRNAIKNTKFVLASVLMLQTLGLAVIPNISTLGKKDLKAEAITFSSGRKTSQDDGVSVILDQKLTDNGNGKYTIELKSSSSLKYEDLSLMQTKVKYGYFEAQQTGDYMVEVWGGDGASGQDSYWSKGGKGGKGGHIYGVVSLNAGDIIFYTIGGNGQQTLSNDTGGGANGDGGDHGDNGSYYVGGGGGYTAVYRFTGETEVNKFKSDYLDENNNLKRKEALEEDRTSKYIMIAGGGGGGGAGNSYSITDKAVRTPDGGQAGDLTSPHDELIGSYPVEGTYYNGSNGFSSGKSQEYVGKGGTVVPGEVNSTFFDFFEGKNPNDWAGTRNRNFPGGSGGSGNLRGGAGGAGFAGGSGGIMTALLIGTNVGGGGGGSSFIAKSVNAPTSAQEIYLSGSNTSDTGGAFYISYMPSEENLEHFNELNLEGEISKYFTLDSYTCKDSTGANVPVSIVDNKFTASAVKSAPTTPFGNGTSTTLTLNVSRKDGFMGGNDVPLFTKNNLKYSYVKNSNSNSFNVDLVETCAYVNIPYAFELETYSYTKIGNADDPCTDLSVSDLYKDNGYVANSSSVGYDFIESITDYSIKSASKTYKKTDPLSLTESTVFTVGFKVTPKTGSGKAIVGEKLTEKEYSKTAKVTLISPSSDTLNGNPMKYQKALNYDASTGKYTLSFDVSSTLPAVRSEFKYSSGNSGSYTVPEDGQYYVQLWGGKGGKGGDNGYSGGNAGAPGYVGMQLALKANDVVTYSIGANGANGDSGNLVVRGQGGKPGIGTYIKVGEQYVLAAAGSGGGGGALWTGPGGSDASDVSSTNFNTGTFDASTISGGSPVTGAINSAAASSGTNYKNQAYLNEHPIDSTVDISGFGQNDYTNNGGGAFYITEVGKEKGLTGYKVTANFTSNFVLDDVIVDGASSYLTSGSTVSEIVPNITNQNRNLSINFKVSYVLSPAETCLGGVDIKLLDSLYLEQTDINEIPDDFIEVAAQDPTDYANVRIKPSLAEEFSLETYEVDTVYGNSVDISSLYSASTTFEETTDLSIKEASDSFGGESSVSPEQTTDYAISYGVQASGEAQKAVVGPNVDPVLIQQNARVNVYNALNYDLKDIIVDAETKEIDGVNYYIYTPGQDYEATLTPAVGMELPDEVTVLIDGNPSQSATLTDGPNGSKILTISGSELGPKSSVSISGSAKEKTFKLHYLVSIDATGYVTKDFVVELKAGLTGEPFEKALEDLLKNYPVGDAPSITGYTFTIEYPDGEAPTEMPAYDLWINGCYHPNQQTLTIHYVDGGDISNVFDTYVDDEGCYYDKDIDITSLDVTGYAPYAVKKMTPDGLVDASLNPARIQFTMPNEPVELYVLYMNNPYSAVINYVCKDNINLPESTILTKTDSDNFEFTIPTIAGYQATVNGELADKISGTYTLEMQNFVVTYEPIKYILSFNVGEGCNNEFADRTVFYGHEIGYTGETYETSTFIPLPTPTKVGYEFKGWLLNGFLVDGLTKFAGTNDAELVALWDKAEYSVTIRFSADDESGNPDLPDEVVLTGLYGETYEYTAPEIEGYSLPSYTISGEFIASNIFIDVTYQINSHTITVQYVDQDGNTMFETETYENVKYNSEYSFSIDAEHSNPQYTINPSSEKFEGQMPDEDLNLVFVYSFIITTVTEENSEVTFTPETVTYDGDDHTPEVSVTVNGKTLDPTTDYDVYFEGSTTDAGEVLVTIVFKGDYEGTLTETYVINPKNTESTLNVEGISEETYTYTGEEIKPTPEVKDGDKVLEEGVDFEYEYVDNIEKGEAEVIIHFINNYADTPDQTITFEIVAKDISESSINVEGIESPVTYNGESYEPEVTVTYVNEEGETITLVENQDYVVIYGKNTEAGDGTVTIKFINNYSDTPDQVEHFTISPQSVDSTLVEVTGISEEGYTFTGSEITPTGLTITYDGEELVEGVDFEISYVDNIDVNSDDNTPTVVITFKGNYSGEKDVEFTINPKDATSTLDIQDVSEETYTYTGEEIKPTPEVKDGDKVLEEGVDFEYEYVDNVDAGEAEVIIHFINNYADTPDQTISFEIVAKDISESSINVEGIESPVTYNGESYEPEVTVTYVNEEGETITLVENQDYEIVYSDNTEAGEATVTIKFINNYSDTPDQVEHFTISPQSVNPTLVEVTGISEEGYTFTGSEITPTGLTITYDGEELVEGVDFEISYKENIHVNSDDNTPTVIITFIGNYSGEKDVEFEINPKTITDPTTELTITPTPDPTNPIVRPDTGEDPDLMPITIIDNETGEELTNPDDFIIVIDPDTGDAEIILQGDYKTDDDEGISLYYELMLPEVSDIENQEYQGEQIKPEVEITFNGETLVEGEDYIVEYGENEELGTGTVTITFINDYEHITENPIVKTFNIVVTEIDSSKLDVDYVAPETYDGTQHTPTPGIYYDGHELIEGVDFDYSYGENIHAGDGAGTVIITFKGGYSSDEPITIYFDIVPKTLNTEGIEVTPSSSEGNPIEIPETGECPFDPEIEIVDTTTGETLTEGEDYIITIDEDNNEIIIEFINDYEGTESIVEEYEKVPGDASEHLQYEEIPDQEFDPDGNEPKPVITDEGGNPLEEGEDYELEYYTDPDTGETEVIVHFEGLYEETPDLHIPYNVVPKDLGDNADISFAITEVVYNGEAIEPGVIVKDGEKVLEEGVDYIVHYVNNNDPGTGSAIIEFIGNYVSTDMKIVDFDIKAGSLDNRTSANGQASVIVTYEEGFDPDITLTAVLRDEIPEEVANQSKSVGRFYTTYGDYEIKLYDKNGNEVQPSDIKEGAVLTLKIQIPAELEGKDIRLVHYHSGDDISIIVRGDEAGIGTYVIEEGYIVTQINKFSDFSLVYEETCLAHWFLLTVAILDILLIAAVIIMGKKQSKLVGIAATVWLTIVTAVSAIFAHCTICYVMLGINVALILFNILFFAMWKGKEEPQQVQSQPQVVYVQAPANAQSAPIQTVQEALVAPAQEPVKEEQTEALTLKESMAKAQTVSTSTLSINKITVANWLKETYGDKVVVNTRENLTSTGLPLADTHYIYLGEDKKCFIYVYEVNDKCFFLVRSDDMTANKVRSHNHKMIPSAFPKTRDYAKWYTMLLDNSYANNESVFATLKYIISHLGVAQVVSAPVVEKAPAPVVEEAPKVDLSLKESISEAKEVQTTVNVNKEVIAKFLSKTYGDKVVVNTRGNMTSTGLPLADTHYIYLGEDKKCFIYVYEVEGKCFCILRSDDETAKEVRTQGHKFVSSAFPKTRDYAKWFTMLFDDSYKTNEDVLNTIKFVVDRLGLDSPKAHEEPAKEEETKSDLSLKESMAEAKETKTDVTINKENVAKWLSETYGDKVVVNTRGNMTSTGLPLADTHYLFMGEDKKCFIYVYEVDAKCFFIVRGNEEIAKEVKALKHKFVSSAFPKTRDYAKWYTMLIDESYNSSDEVFNTLKVVIEGLLGNKEEVVVEETPKADLSLKESMAEAKETVTALSINKENVAKHLSETYGDKVVVNTRENMTSTGLPLADTHYLFMGEDKKCFIYVYEVDGKCFFIVRGNEEIAKEVKALKHKFVSSAFPKTRDYAKWYTMLIDDSYKSNEDVFSTLDKVIASLLGGNSTIVEEPVVSDEPEINDLSLKESIAKAKEAKANVEMNKENIAKWLKETYGDKVVINTRENMTSTGLPLADTHYIEVNGVKKCFIYIYELNGNCFAIIRSDEETAKEVRKDKHKFISSAFPKTRDYAKWYTMLFDESYSSSDEIFETLSKIIENIKL